MRNSLTFRILKPVAIRFLFALLIFATPTGVVADPALWRVEGSEGTLYLFGTIHVLPAKTKWLSPELEEIFDKSDRVVLEVVFSQIDEDALSFLAQTTNVFRSTISLEKRLTKELYGAFKARMTAFGLEEVQFNRYQPWYAAVVLTRLENEEAGYFNWFGVDSRLQIRAQGAEKELISLETATQQVMFFAEMPLVSQINYLAGIVERVNENKARLDAQLNAWISGDIKATEELALKPFVANWQRYQVFIKNRNTAWLPTLEDLLNLPGTHFVAVGTAHLIGPDGLIKLLEEKGYSVVRQ